MKKTRNYSPLGFTLVEMLVVIAIAMILMSILFASFQQSRAKARDDNRASDMAQIQLALRLYAENNGYYPKAFDGIEGQITRGGGSVSAISTEVDQYLGSIPTDPKHNGTDFYYQYDANVQCDTNVYKIALFAHKMETNKYKNLTEVQADCPNITTADGSPDADSYVIIIGRSHPDDT